MIPYNPEDLTGLLALSEANLTARAFIAKISAHLGIRSSEARAVLRQLVEDRHIGFQDLYGSTYVMESLLKPVRITDRFFIVPPGQESGQALDIQILPGIAFGAGNHPTTRLCLKALDHLFFTCPASLPGDVAGDVGTGSGILAIAACLGGLATCLAWDIDANAASEARANVALNGLGQRIQIIEGFMPPQESPLAMICANLRAPTLHDLAGLFNQSLLPKGFLVLSGLRSWEAQDLMDAYQALGFSPVWSKTLKQWTGLILAKSLRDAVES